MTVAKSKYYMLKVNYPKLAEIIDNEPIYEIEEEEQQSEQLSNSRNEVDAAIRVKPLVDQAQSLDSPEDEALNRELK